MSFCSWLLYLMTTPVLSMVSQMIRFHSVYVCVCASILVCGMHVCMHVCVWAHTSRSSCICLCKRMSPSESLKARGLYRVSFSITLPFIFFETISHWTWSSLSQTGWTANPTDGSCLSLPVLESYMCCTSELVF